MEIVLASASPRRREILARILPTFFVIPSTCPETADLSQPPARIVEQLARQKAEDVYRSHTAALVLGADTVVWAGGRLLGKPKDAADAARMLRSLSGRAHEVYTGVAVLCCGGEQGQITRCHAVRTEVYVHDMTDDEIRGYIATGEPADKAGGYGIQGAFAKYIDRIDGDYYNVVGLPVSYVYQTLKEMGAL